MLIKYYQDAVQKRTRLTPAEWCTEHVKLFRSTDSTNYRAEFTPWWSEPMNEIRDNQNRVVCITTPVGSGKSTLIEAMTCNILANDPGPMLITGQTNEDVRDWAETGLWPTLASCEPLKSRLPTAKGKWRKMELIIPRAPVHLTGANMSGLQSKSERWVIGDEAWMWRKGMIGEMLKRLHRRWNGRAILLGQAGFVQHGEEEEIIGDDFTLLHYQGEQREWCFQCPSCGEVQPYGLEQFKMPEDGTNAERALAVEYECESCEKRFADTSETRRAFADSARYVTTREAILPGHVSFHLNAFALWRSPWSDIMLEYLTAQDAMSTGQPLPLQQFMQKQMAEPWDESMQLEKTDLALAEGSVSDYQEGEKIENEAIRFATVDCGRDHFWLAIRAWRPDASSVGIYYAKVNTAEMVKELCVARGVKPNHVYIDSGYEAGKVYDLCARFGWMAIKGDSVNGYRHRQKGGGIVQRLMSTRTSVAAPCGKRVPLVHLAVNPIKDILARLREGSAATWEILPDIGDAWTDQIDSEEREEFLHPKTKQPTMRWIKRKRANHAWDCEVYQVAAALIWKIFPS
tara:strand:+ start:549 stop:2264 length:1716 start_codon:yes stop_codon:yes gene_type:complete